MTAESLKRNDSVAHSSGRHSAGVKSKQDLAKAGRQKLEEYRNKKKFVKKSANERSSEQDLPSKDLALFVEKSYGPVEEAWGQESEGIEDGANQSIENSHTTDHSSLQDSAILSSVELLISRREKAVCYGTHDNEGPPVLPIVEAESPVQLGARIAAVHMQPASILESSEVEGLDLPVSLGDGLVRKWRGANRAPEHLPTLPSVHNASASSLSSLCSQSLPADSIDQSKTNPIRPAILPASLSELFPAIIQATSSPKQNPISPYQQSSRTSSNGSPSLHSRLPVPDSLYSCRERTISGLSEWQPQNKIKIPPLAPSLKPSPAAFQNGGKSSEVADSITVGAAFDFHTLEQHIDSLTVEKFALQRSIDSAKALADALVDENRGFMDTFNQQGAAMKGMRQELQERLEEVYSLQMVATGALEERDRAVEEAGGATERSQTLAKEVIALEEKVLQLRSSELKLEAALNIARGEAEGSKQSVASLGRERVHVKQQLSGLYDEKRVLQFRLRRLTLGGALNDICGSSVSDATTPLFLNATTSTHDLEAKSQTMAAFQDSSSTSPENGPQQQLISAPVKDFQLPAPITLAVAAVEPSSTPEQEGRGGEGSGLLSMDAAASTSLERVTAVIASAMAAVRGDPPSPGPADVALLVPQQHPDEALMSIERFLDEILLEKRSLLCTRAASIAAANKLQVSNTELCSRLSLQAQRLELACAQSMRETSPRLSPPRLLHKRSQNDKEYTDDSDEVAERVLSWLLGLLPGGRGT